MPFKVGDKVHFTKQKRSGRTITFTKMDATIDEVSEVDPDIVVCKYRNGRKVRVHTSRLRHEGEKSELTDALFERDKK
jgi:hypothetical protein